MTRDELIVAGWTNGRYGFERGAERIFCHKDYRESYHEAAAVLTFGGRFSCRMEGRGVSAESALQRLGECVTLEGRTVREWALAKQVP